MILGLYTFEELALILTEARKERQWELAERVLRELQSRVSVEQWGV